MRILACGIARRFNIPLINKRPRACVILPQSCVTVRRGAWPCIIAGHLDRGGGTSPGGPLCRKPRHIGRLLRLPRPMTQHWWGNYFADKTAKATARDMAPGEAETREVVTCNREEATELSSPPRLWFSFFQFSPRVFRPLFGPLSGSLAKRMYVYENTYVCV